MLVRLESVSFTRGRHVIFDNITITIPQGKITAIMGPSGTGKTTLLRLIGGQLKPEKGQVWFEDKNINQLSYKALYEVRKNMAMLFQSGALLTDLNVFENVAFPLREHTQLSERFIKDIVLLKLQAVGLRGAYTLMPSQLSGGMARRVALARAIVLDPHMIMYDEPFAGQDPITMATLVTLIKKLNQTLGLTSIVVSHDVPETLSIADYVYFIAEGRVQAQGSVAELKQDNSEFVQQFIHGFADGSVAYPSPSLEQDFLL